MASITKVCIKCNEEKDISEFHFRTDTKKYRNECNKCNLEFHKKLYREQAEEKKAWARAYSKEYYPTVKDKKRKYAIENKEKIQKRMEVYQKDYYIKNKERIDKKNKKWSDDFPEKRAVLGMKRRVLEMKAEGSFTPKEWKDLCDKYGNKCLRCGKYGKMSVDHVIPLVLGGKNSIDNLQPLCRNCNSAKHTKTTDYRPKE